MSQVLTSASTVACSHGGTVATSATTTLRVGGKGVLLEVGEAVTCPQPTQTRCTKVTAVSQGQAARLTVKGDPVLLASLQGTTDKGTLSATANQQTLNAS